MSTSIMVTPIEVTMINATDFSLTTTGATKAMSNAAPTKLANILNAISIAFQSAGGDPVGKPTGGAQQPGVGIARTDELHAEGQAVPAPH